MEIRRQESFDSRGWLRQIIWQISTFFLLFGICFFLANRMPWNALFPIREVEISGAVLSNHQLLKAEILPFVKDGFFNVRVAQIKERLLLGMPWIEDVYIRLGWPNTLLITLYEKKPAALWNQNALLDNQGGVFTVPDLSQIHLKTLPLLEGESSRQEMVLYIYKQIQPLLLPISPIARIALHDDLYWEIHLQNGLILFLGMQDVVPALTRFIAAYPKVIGEHVDVVDYVDLRYANGIAVRWRSIASKNHSAKK